MSRKVSNVTIADDNRDKGKVFVLTELAALDAYKWGLKAISAMIRAGADLPEELLKMGMVGVLSAGVFRLGYVPFAELEPLHDELLSCIQYMPTPERPDVVRKLFVGDVEEPTTYARLAKEVFYLHTGFFPPDYPLTSRPPGGLPTGESQ